MRKRKHLNRPFCLGFSLLLMLLSQRMEILHGENETGDHNYENVRLCDISKGHLMLCNKEYGLPEAFMPENLSEIEAEYLASPDSRHFLQRDAAEAFERMSDAARSEGIYLLMFSAYRDRIAQGLIYKEYSDRLGQEFADTYAARPGHSEHETGLSCDIYEIRANSPAYFWLLEHAHKFGYILRYPEGKEHLTGYNFEAWHWRYLGPFLATSVKMSGLSYEEYYQNYIEKWPGFVFFFFR